MKIIFFQRKPFRDFVSIEHVFDMIRANLPNSVEAQIHISKYHSKGVWRRIYNIFEAVFQQGEINHITGDVNFLILLLKRKKSILSIHDLHFLNNKSGLRYYFLKLFWITLPCKKAKYITTVSNYTKNDLLRVYGNYDIEKKIRVIGNPANLIFEKSPKRFNKSFPILLQVGTKKHKGLHLLIEALQGIPCHLCIIGTLKKSNINLLEKYNIDFSNFINLPIEELSQKYRECDILTFISEKEGFGMPIIEANKIGRAVITGNKTSIPEVAKDAALMVNPQDIEQIRVGILRLINDDDYRNQLIENGFKNAKRFDVQVIANQYLDLYNEVYKL